MDPVEAAAAAHRARQRELAAARNIELLEPWLRTYIKALPYDRPEPDRGGWETLGEVRDPAQLRGVRRELQMSPVFETPTRHVADAGGLAAFGAACLLGHLVAVVVPVTPVTGPIVRFDR
jgi:hypothetical protein